ncbi:hypothetical protein Droror1_Dr00002975 [Drosera rotundifolia]
MSQFESRIAWVLIFYDSIIDVGESHMTYGTLCGLSGVQNASGWTSMDPWNNYASLRLERWQHSQGSEVYLGSNKDSILESTISIHPSHSNSNVSDKFNHLKNY